MYKLYICISLAFASLNLFTYSNAFVEDETELLLTFLINRHGDRTPEESALDFSNNPDALEIASAPYGYGQLTNAGKRRAYQLGQFIRRRYNGLLSPQYNKSEIYIRTTDSPRTKMTVLTAMAAVYPADENNWSQDINWTPVPYANVPAKYDFNLASVNCPNYMKTYANTLLGPAPSMYQYADILSQWSDITGFPLTSYPVFSYGFYDVYVSQISLGVPLEPEIEAILPEIEKVADAAVDVWICGTDEGIAFEAGVLLNTFYDVAEQIIAGKDVQRVYIYSAHDINVYAFECATAITPRQGVPKYASAFALELRKVPKSGEIVVVPVYLDTPSEDLITYLDVNGCENQCAFETFRNLTSKYALKEDEWRTLCGFTEDMVIDTLSVTWEGTKESHLIMKNKGV